MRAFMIMMAADRRERALYAYKSQIQHLCVCVCVGLFMMCHIFEYKEYLT